MRTVIAGLGGITMLFVGIFAISQAATQAEGEVSTAAETESFNVALDVFSGLGFAGDAVVWGGVAAVVLVALGVLVAAGSATGGR